MKEDKYIDPFTKKIKHEIRIERDDIEQALSWYDTLSVTETNKKDEQVYYALRKAVSYMRSLDIE